MKTSLNDNVRDWILFSPIVIAIGLLPLQELPFFCWFHGVLVGYMVCWILQILETWTKSLIVKDEQENKK